MIYLLLSILSSTLIFVIFKIINQKSLPIANIIAINYFTASIIGQTQGLTNPINAIDQTWFPFALFIGILFIIFFFIISYSSKIVGITKTTVASKMSVIIPILFSILYFQENLNFYKILGISLALFGVFFTIHKKSESSSKINISHILVPLILFIGMGLNDSILKYTQEIYISPESNAFFSSTLFGVSAIAGLIYTLTNKERILGYKDYRVYIYGTLLGMVNFGSIYFLIGSLNTNVFDSSIIFGINNVGIVILSVLLGIIIFKEKITQINIFGIICSVIAIVALSIS